jgi:thiamine-phosphate pyrophosphorylase
MLEDKKALLLYAVTDRRWLNGGSLKDQVEKAIKGGATFIQLREKDLDRASFKAEALEIQALCRAYHIPFVLDDDVDLAVEINADGVHVGQKDLEASCARQKLGPNRILGVSAQTVEEARAAEKAGADYLGVGAVFPTGSKDDADEVSHEALRDICRSVSIPVIAIGGITRDNVKELSGTGIVGIAVISAIFAKEDITAAAADLKQQTLKALEQSK